MNAIWDLFQNVNKTFWRIAEILFIIFPQVSNFARTLSGESDTVTAPTNAVMTATTLTVSWNCKNFEIESYTLRPHITASKGSCWSDESGVMNFSRPSHDSKRKNFRDMYLNDWSEVVVGEDDVRSLFCYISTSDALKYEVSFEKWTWFWMSATYHSEADIGLFQCGTVIGTITSYGDDLPVMLTS